MCLAPKPKVADPAAPPPPPPPDALNPARLAINRGSAQSNAGVRGLVVNRSAAR